MTRRHRRWHLALWLIVPAAAAGVLLLGLSARAEPASVASMEREP